MAAEKQSRNGRVYDLEERTAQFGECVIDFAKNALYKDVTNNVLISQIVRSATSIGANYMEADSAQTKKDFFYKIALCRKESKETKHWLRMILKANPEHAEVCNKLSIEAKELTLIFSAIASKRNSK